MRKFASLIAGAGLMLLAHGAQATGFTLAPGPGSSGTYTATVTWTGTSFSINGVTADGGSPNGTGDAVRVYFLNGGSFVAGTGTSTGGTDGGGTNWGPFYNVSPGGGVIYSQWDTIANQSNALLTNGSNTFTETGSINSGAATSAMIEVLGQNGLTWLSGSFTPGGAPPPVIPDGSAMPMLLSGLLPLGMVLRRRASRK